MATTLFHRFHAIRMTLFCGVLALAFVANVAEAVIINTASGLGNTTAPADDPGFANVGDRGGYTGVYLGNRWVLTANHVRGGDIVLRGGTYSMKDGTGFQLTNREEPGKSTLTDLYMYQLTADPGLPWLDIATASSGSGTAVTMIGNGFNRGDFKTWLVNTGTTPWAWTENTSNYNAAGYVWGTGHTIRWGTNDVAGATWVNKGYGDVYTAYTTFNVGYYSSECQAAVGDSGGAVFRKNGDSWQLAGIMLAVDGYSGQPADTAVYGNHTYFADLSVYQPQIVAVVPEPGALVLAAIGAGALGLGGFVRRFKLPMGSRADCHRTWPV